MITTTRRRLLGLAGCLAATGLAHWQGASLAFADALAKPVGDVVLTIDGAISNHNEGQQADFDMAMITAMPVTSFRTTTPWTDGRAEFTGVLAKDLFAAVGATGTSIKASALNDYIAEVDVETLVSAGAIIAYKVNGAEISVRDKGPLWIMFPFDEKPQLRAESIYSQSVWQLRRLSFRQ